MTLVVMSSKELGRVSVLQDGIAGRMTIAAAAAVLALSRRQVFRLLRAFHAHGAEGLISRRRGRPSNRRYPEDVRRLALSLVREHSADFGPTLAAEKLAENHGLALGLWADRKMRLRPVHQPRHRRDCVGELIQIDGSTHWWFEDRDAPCSSMSTTRRAGSCT